MRTEGSVHRETGPGQRDAAGTQVRSALPPPGEMLGLFLVTGAASVALALWLEPLLPDRTLLSYLTHVPQLVLPLAWFQLRVRPALAPADPAGRPFRWRAGSPVLFAVLASTFAGLNLLDELTSSPGTPPAWLHGGTAAIVLALVFQGLVVGFAEEMMIRVGLHLPLKRRWAGTRRAPWALIVAAIGFGLLHLPNLLLGQSVSATLGQVGVAVVLALLIGLFYQRTENFVGAALLHNLFNLAGAVGLLLVHQ